jgi:hypothetical protein
VAFTALPLLHLPLLRPCRIRLVQRLDPAEPLLPVPLDEVLWIQLADGGVVSLDVDEERPELSLALAEERDEPPPPRDPSAAHA